MKSTLLKEGDSSHFGRAAAETKDILEVTKNRTAVPFTIAHVKGFQMALTILYATALQANTRLADLEAKVERLKKKSK